MSTSPWDRIWELFHQAAEVPPGERSAWLDRACRDPVLRSEVEALLEAAEAGSGLLESPGPLAALLGEADPAEAGAGEDVGPYRLVRPVGEGGMGVVWEAEQQAPLRRRVALKLVKLGMDTREVLARFDAERQALALMEHPGIARVFDAGATAGGKPYFVMEYVEGLAIDEYCDRNGLRLGERLGLFVRVCDAVQHAHQKGIIHRDLKPGNVLVAPDGGPKVIDFGIAKAIDRSGTERTAATVLGHLVGTPEYMSPEQAALAADVDTRTDVYALGILLYELLVGVPPFDFEGLSHTDIQRVLREEEPPRPSTRVAALGEGAAEAARRRGTDPAALRRELARDLDWIVMKALARERDERYGTVAELAADVGHYLRHEPVLAGPPAVLYRLRKFARRHAAGVATAGVVLAVILGASVALGWQSHRLSRALEREAGERARAEEVSGFLVDLFRSQDPLVARGEEVSGREILDRGIERIEGGLDRQPLVKAALLATTGQVAHRLGEYETSRRLFERALELRRRHLGDGDPEVAAAHYDLGLTLYASGDYAAAAAHLRSALAIRGVGTGDDPRPRANAVLLLGAVLQAQGELDGAAARYEEALAATGTGDDELRAWILLRQASLSLERRDFEVAEATASRALEIQEHAFGTDDPRLVPTRTVLAQVLHRAARYRLAEEMYRRNLAVQERVFGADHPDVGSTLNGLGALLYDRGDDGDAGPVLRRAIAIWRGLGEEGRVKLSSALNNLALVEHRANRYGEAEGLHLEALGIDREIYGEESAKVASDLNNLGWLYHDMGELDRAASFYRRSLGLHRAVFGSAHPSTAFQLDNLAQLHAERGQIEEAEGHARAGLEVRQATLPADHPQVATSLSTLGAVLTTLGRAAEAQPLLRQALAIRQARLGADDWQTAETASALGECLAALGRGAEAAPLLREGHASLLAAKGPEDRRTRRALLRLDALD